MNKFLLASTISMLSLAAFAEPVQVQQISAEQAETQGTPSVYQKQTVVRYNVPTCKNCQTTTTVTRVVKESEALEPAVPCNTGSCNSGCSSCGSSATVTAAPVYRQRPKSCVFDNHRYAIGNPLFVLREGQFSSQTVAGFFVEPRLLEPIGEEGGETIYSKNSHPRRYNWKAAERIMYGITDRVALKLQAGYLGARPRKSEWMEDEDQKWVPHSYAYSATVGLQAHAIDACNFDVIVGVDGTWGRRKQDKYMKYVPRIHSAVEIKAETTTSKFITPYAIVGGQISKYLTPYVQADYQFSIGGKKKKDNDKDGDIYTVQPGIYIQPNKYWAIHPSIIFARYAKPEWNLAVDFYPYQNLVIGLEATGISWGSKPIGQYGLSGQIKMTF